MLLLCQHWVGEETLLSSRWGIFLQGLAKRYLDKRGPGSNLGQVMYIIRFLNDQCVAQARLKFLKRLKNAPNSIIFRPFFSNRILPCFLCVWKTFGELCRFLLREVYNISWRDFFYATEEPFLYTLMLMTSMRERLSFFFIDLPTFNSGNQKVFLKRFFDWIGNFRVSFIIGVKIFRYFFHENRTLLEIR